MSSGNIDEDGNVITMVNLQNEIKIINERMKESIFNKRSLKMQERLLIPKTQKHMKSHK